MQSNQKRELEQRIELLTEYLSTIRRNMEGLVADNHRLREVVRIAESELRKRRDQAELREHEMEGMQNAKLEAKARVEHVLEKVDELLSNQQEDAS
ncbi:MAG: hypothetical protein Q9M31_10185 [Mariprofundus sp.]|nr:hypothetical protein [Mariprofundus sp.]